MAVKKRKKAKKIPIKIPIGMRGDRFSLRGKSIPAEEETVLSKTVKEAKEAIKRWERAERLTAEKERQMRTPKLTPITKTKLENIQRIKRIIIKGTGLAALKGTSSKEKELLRSRIDTLNRVHDFLKTASVKEIADSLASRKQFSHMINKEVSEEEFAVIKKSIALAKDKDALLRGLRATRGELERMLRASPEKIPAPAKGIERGELAAAEAFSVPAGLLYTSIVSDPKLTAKFIKEMRKAEKTLSKGRIPSFLRDPASFKKKFGVTPTQDELEALTNIARAGKVSALEEGLSRISVEKPFEEVGESKRRLDLFMREMERAKAQIDSGEVPEFLKSPEAFQKRFGVKPSKQALGEIRRMIKEGQADLLFEGIRRARQAQGRLLQGDLKRIRDAKAEVRRVSGIKLSLGVKRLEAFRDFNQKLLELMEKNKEKIIRGELPEELTNAKKFKKYFGLTPEEAEEISKRIEKGALIGGAAGTATGTALVLSQAALFSPIPLVIPVTSYAITGFGLGGLAGKAGEEGVYKARQLKTKKTVKGVRTEKDYNLFIRALRANIREIDKKIEEAYKKSGGRKK